MNFNSFLPVNSYGSPIDFVKITNAESFKLPPISGNKEINNPLAVNTKLADVAGMYR
jgi:hypothetical protein